MKKKKRKTNSIIYLFSIIIACIVGIQNGNSQEKAFTDTIPIQMIYNGKEVEDVSIFIFSIIIKDSLDTKMDSIYLKGNNKKLLLPANLFSKDCQEQGQEYDLMIIANNKTYIISRYPCFAFELKRWALNIGDFNKKKKKKYKANYQYTFGASGLWVYGFGN